MFAAILSELLLGLSAGVLGVILVIIGVPTCVAVFGRSFLRAYRSRRVAPAALGLLITAGVALLGAGSWGFATNSAPGVYDEPLAMLAVTFLPFTVAFAVLALVVQHNTLTRARSEKRRVGLAR